MSATDGPRSHPPAILPPALVRAIRRKRTMPARVAAALALLLGVAACGASEPSGPQLPCSDAYRQAYQVAGQLQRDDDVVSDLWRLEMKSQSERHAEMCTRARAVLQQHKELQKLIRDNKDRCKEFDFSPMNIGQASAEFPPSGSRSVVELAGLCK
jgi:hypothetical protein